MWGKKKKAIFAHPLEKVKKLGKVNLLRQESKKMSSHQQCYR